MSRVLIKIAVFFLTLVLSVQTAAFISSVIGGFSTPVEISIDSEEKQPAVAELPSGVRIMYNGMYSGSSEFGEGLRFIIFNGSTENVSCIGYNGRCASPEIKINGIDVAAWVCMNGSSTYMIEPGRSAELMVSADDFARLPGKAENITIGYSFADATGRSSKYFAEPIILPTKFREAIRSDIAERGSY